MTTDRTRVTIAEIAREAGVSEATVSKVLNGRTEVAPATRTRVQDLLDARGYERRGIRVEERTGLIDLVISELNTPWSMDVLRGAEHEARRAGTAVVVTSTEGRSDESWLDRVTERRSDGVLLVLSPLPPGAARRLTAAGIPFVLVDPVGGFDPAIPTIGVTNWAGALAATEHLIALGHRRIAAITGPPDLVCSQQRLEGYRAALGRAGMPVDDDLIRYGDFRAVGGAREAYALLETPDPPTAIFAGSDLQATGVYQEAHRRGMRIPDQLSVIGFDDVALCEWVSPPLTTVRQPLLEMARMAIRSVLDPSSSDQPLRLELATSLITRESTARPPG